MAMPLSRRAFLTAGGAAALSTGSPEALALGAAGGAEVSLREGTNISAALSPDRSTVVFDLLGTLWSLPLDGGTARPITGESVEAAQPHWSPDGRSIAFQGYIGGNFHLFVVAADGSGLRQLTSGPFDHREPAFSPDGRRIAFSSDRGGGYGVHLLDAVTGEIVPLPGKPEAEETSPAWSPDGRLIAVATTTATGAAIDAVDLDGNRRRLATVTSGRTGAPSWSPDGETIVYAAYPGGLTGPLAVGASLLMAGDRVVSGPDEDVFPFRAAWLSPQEILYTADGRLRVRHLGGGDVRDVRFTARVPVTPRRDLPGKVPTQDGRRPARGIVSPALSPDGANVAFCALGDLWLMRIGGRPRRLTGGGHFVTDPAWSPDGRRLAYTSDRSGGPDLWIRDLDTGLDRRLVARSHAAVAAAWSPDGARIAFQDQDGATYVVDVEPGEVRQVLGPLWQPGRPTWSPDGNVLALAAVRPYSRKYREGTSQILTLDLRTGEMAYHEPAPHRSISTRGLDGPVWSPDGRHLAFVMASRLWTLPVNAAGTPTGPARKVSDETCDAPSWSGDSRSLLYLRNGRLRLVAAAGGPPRPVPLALTWTPAVPSGRTVVHAGRVWDGRSPGYLDDVDLVIERDRIAEIRPHRAGTADVDASRLTVLPGLIDMHVHAHLRGRFLAGRQGRLWLAFGITSIRSPGDPVYRAIEEREAVAAGRRTGPRYFGTGEAIDGSRVYYDFMRPTTGREEVSRELERALGLEYDLIKCYVRLPAAAQRQVIEAAHRAGVWVTSHYLYPAARFGMDGMEHLGATSRLGYSRTVTTRGRAYQDVVALFGAAGMAVTPTLQLGSVAWTRDRSLPTDERVLSLYPAWELRDLNARLALYDSLPKDTLDGLFAALEANVSTVRRIQEAGGLVVAGTDAPLDFTAISLHHNLRAMVEYGMTPRAALTSATSDAARALGMGGQLGGVERGKLADLVFVGGDPLADIRAAANVDKVMVNGVLHEVAALTTLPRESGGRDTRQVAPASASPFWWHEGHAGPKHCC
ncbi:amidohydrolase family protein [Nonomuraea sp. NPDC050404]|uniref:amidohydrolase family protein n=1 Tax=Nonomuraea sp. NPDC050404 TaxID=3155783 RepID=UPI0033F1E227